MKYKNIWKAHDFLLLHCYFFWKGNNIRDIPTCAIQAITGISCRALAFIGADCVCTEGILVTMVIIPSTFIKILVQINK